MPNTIAKNRVFYCPTHVKWNKILSVYTKLFVNKEGILGNVTVGSVRAGDCRPEEWQPFASVVSHCKTRGSDVRKEHIFCKKIYLSIQNTYWQFLTLA